MINFQFGIMRMLRGERGEERGEGAPGVHEGHLIHDLSTS